MVHVPKWYVIGWFSYKTVYCKAVHGHYGMLHNSTHTHNLEGSANPWIDWDSGALFIVTDHIRVRLGYAKCPTNPWVGGALLIVTDHPQS
jgi:hypothetical protein